MSDRDVYLDHAATSWPKPAVVLEAMQDFLANAGGNTGRSGHRRSIASSRAVSLARERLADLLGAESPDELIFTKNATEGLNVAIVGLAEGVDKIVTTSLEHNSVMRPLRALEQRRRCTVEVVHADGNTGEIDLEDWSAALHGPGRTLAVAVHASNVTGALQPAAEVGAIAREHGALFLLDAAQSLGDVPLDVRTLNVDLLAAPGHKGLLGPLGTGILYVRPGVEERLTSLRQGGTGSQSESDRQPDHVPDKYESGNLNVPGLVGLGAGVAWLAARGVDAVRRHAHALTDKLIEGLAAVDGVTIYGPRDSSRRVGLVSIRLEGYDPQELAATLDAAFGVQVRAGLHCAPLAHEAIGTLSLGGTVRLSLGPFSTEADVETAVDAVREIAAARLTTGS